jgi:DNA-binding MarR family transcriptional regulator
LPPRTCVNVAMCAVGCYSHGFLIQQLVQGPRPIGEIAEDLGLTSQAISKAVRELEALGYVDRSGDAADGRVRRVALTDRDRAVLDAGREIRAALNAELAAALGTERAETAAGTLKAGLEALGAMPAVEARRVPPSQL